MERNGDPAYFLSAAESTLNAAAAANAANAANARLPPELPLENDNLREHGNDNAAAQQQQQQLLEVLRQLPVDEKILARIDHSIKLSDDVFEYRYVLLPRNHPMLELGTDFRRRLLTEQEWRSLGIRQTRGWEHCGFSPHEVNALLFRRAVGTDPRSGRCRDDAARARLAELSVEAQRYQLMRLAPQETLLDGPCSFGGGVTRTPLLDRVPLLGTQQRMSGVQPAEGLTPLNGDGRHAPATLARLMAASLRVLQAAERARGGAIAAPALAPTLDAATLRLDWFNNLPPAVEPLPPARTLDEVRFVNDVDFLYARKLLPPFTQ